MNILCIDFGLKRIGMAVGSTESGIAFPREVLLNDEKLFENLSKTITEDSIHEILVGMPLKRDMTPGDIDDKLQKFVAQLKSRFALPVELIDERYTSKIAEAKLHEIGMNAKDQKSVSDSTAAQVILQEWLDD